MEGEDLLTIRLETALVADKALTFLLEPRHQCSTTRTEELSSYAYSLPTVATRKQMRCGALNRLGLFLGTAVLAVVLFAAPNPLVVTLQNPTRNVTIYPNILIVIPLILLAALLLLYGATAENRKNTA